MKSSATKKLSIILSTFLLMQTLLPSVTAQAMERTVILGDVNYDGGVSLRDASLLQQYSLDLIKFTDEQVYLGDVTADGSATLADAYLIQHYVTSRDAECPVNADGYRLGDTFIIDSPYEEIDPQTDTEVIETDSDSDETDSSLPETDTAEETDSDDFETDSVITETDSEIFDPESDVIDTESDLTDTDSETETESDTDTETETETDTYFEEYIEDQTRPVGELTLLPIEQIQSDLNGDFERGDSLADNWITTNGSLNGKTEAGSGTNGSKALKFSHSGARTSFTLNYISGLEPGADYKLTAKIKGENITRGNKEQNGAWIDVGYCLYYGISNVEGATSVVGRGSNICSLNNWKDGTFDWTEVTVYFVPDIKGCADIVCALTGSGTAYYDDLRIEKIDDFNADQTYCTRYLAEHVGLVMQREDVADLDQNEVQEWADELSEGYDEIADLFNKRPHCGDRIYIISTEEPNVSGVQAYGNITPIKWFRPYAAGNCKNRVEKNIKSMTPFHEMGHNFDGEFDWTWQTEISADCMALYVAYLHPDDVYDYRGWCMEYQDHKYEQMMEYLKSVDSNCYDKEIANKNGTYYVTSMCYVMFRSFLSVGIDTTKTALHRLSRDYDRKYVNNEGKFLYLMMSLQETYNETHPDATGREVFDSFPDDEFYFMKDATHYFTVSTFTPEQEIFAVQFKDVDGTDLWFDFVPYGETAQAPQVADSPKYGRFVGWSEDISNVTSDMTVTPVYENTPAITITACNADDGSSQIYQGEFATVTLSGGSSDIVGYRMTATGGTTFDTGYTTQTSNTFMVKNSGGTIVDVYVKLSDGTELFAGSEVINALRSVTVYYNGYANPNIHYQVGTGAWTAVPGVAMKPTSSLSGYTHKYIIPASNVYALTVTACFNDGGSTWDNNGEKNYTMNRGVYGIKNGVLTDLSN